MAGYSGTPLAQKLGIKPGARVAMLSAPDRFEKTLEPLPEGVALAASPTGKPFDVILLFADRAAALPKRFAAAAKKLAPAGGLWVCWPKKASGVPTDVTEPVVREIGLASGLVDNKVCAVDGTWSGLRFVIRVKDRPKASARRLLA